jgi:hypothetical protein
MKVILLDLKALVKDKNSYQLLKTTAFLESRDRADEQASLDMAAKLRRGLGYNYDKLVSSLPDVKRDPVFDNTKVVQLKIIIPELLLANKELSIGIMMDFMQPDLGWDKTKKWSGWVKTKFIEEMKLIKDQAARIFDSPLYKHNKAFEVDYFTPYDQEDLKEVIRQWEHTNTSPKDIMLLTHNELTQTAALDAGINVTLISPEHIEPSTIFEWLNKATDIEVVSEASFKASVISVHSSQDDEPINITGHSYTEHIENA